MAMFTLLSISLLMLLTGMYAMAAGCFAAAVLAGVLEAKGKLK